MAADPFCDCCEPAVHGDAACDLQPAGTSEIAYRIGTFATFREAMLELIAQQAALAGLTTREATTTPSPFSNSSPPPAMCLPSTTSGSPTSCSCAPRASGIRCCGSTRLIGYRLRPGLAARDAPELRSRCGRRNPYPQGLQGDERARPGREAADFRDDSKRSRPMPRSTRPRPSRRPSHSTVSHKGASAGRSYRGHPELAAGDRLILFGRGMIEEKTVEVLGQRADGERLAFSPGVQQQGRDASEAQAAKLEGRLRFFGHGAPETVNVYVPPKRDQLAAVDSQDRRSIARGARLGLSARCALHGHFRRPAVADRNVGIGSREAAHGDRRAHGRPPHGDGLQSKPPRSKSRA